MKKNTSQNFPDDPPMVLYAIIRKLEKGETYFLARQTNGSFTFPPTKMQKGDELYKSLDRIMEGDLKLKRKSFYPEHEFSVIENSPNSPKYEGLQGKWFLYPVAVSITHEATQNLNEPTENLAWMTLDELATSTHEPNTQAIIQFLQTDGAQQLAETSIIPSMNAHANYWARFHDGGVRIAKGETVKKILSSGDRAFNLRVADPYLPYQKQGLGFTWSFFTPKDKQDLHVHGMPAVEIYGVLEGRLQLWWKPMNARGVRVWKHQILEPGDWAEVEPLNCHFAAWLTPEGLGTVIKAAGTGELAGVGRIGVSGKTTCDWSSPDDDEKQKQRKRCNNYGQCQIPPPMENQMGEFQKPFEERIWRKKVNKQR